MKPLTKLEIINETVEFYSADPSRRSMIFDFGRNNNRCVYNGNNNTHCAVGRCMKDSFKEAGLAFKKNNDQISELFDYYGSQINVLKPQYHGHDVEFWVDLQKFHDNDDHFHVNGLTEQGQRFVEKLKETHKST